MAQDGDQALDYTAANKYYLIVLDIMLPRRDGWSVLEALRARGNETPVICLTERDAVEEQVKGLQGGADDYLTKAFAFSVLLARVRTVLKRSPARIGPHPRCRSGVDKGISPRPSDPNERTAVRAL